MICSEIISIGSMLLGQDSDAHTSGLYAAGIHPYDACRAAEGWLAPLGCATDRMVAIGEVGLDYRTEHQPYEAQRYWFARQIEIANTTRKPLIVHTVSAIDDTLEMLRRATVPIIIHGFMGSWQTAQRYLDLNGGNCYLSFGARTTASAKSVEALSKVPSDRLFLETDDTHSPIAAVYDMAAECRSIPEMTMFTDQIFNNFRTIFPTLCPLILGSSAPSCC